MTRIALIGANGYGRSHRRAIAELERAGLATLVGLCDLQPIEDMPDVPRRTGVRVFTDFAECLAETLPDVVAIATPPHTHLRIASAAVEAGADVLVEKPPFRSGAEHDEFLALLDATGRRCQVGFQALGSAALRELAMAIADGRLGQISAISAVGAVRRPDSYYDRAPWAGRRAVNGEPVLDGVLVNPFAHAVMQCLAIAESAGGDAGRLESIDVEKYRARPIEADDTAAVRIGMAGGPVTTIAATLCADDIVVGEITVHGEAGNAILEYTKDVLTLPGENAGREVPGRIGLLRNLVEHRNDPDGVRLIADASRPFSTVVDHLTAAGMPGFITAEHTVIIGHGPERVVTIPGISADLCRATNQGLLPNEAKLPWANALSRRS